MAFLQPTPDLTDSAPLLNLPTMTNTTVLFSRRARSGIATPSCASGHLVKLTKTLLQLIRNQHPKFATKLSVHFMAGVVVRISTKKITRINRILAYMHARPSAFEFYGSASHHQDLFYNEILTVVSLL